MLHLSIKKNSSVSSDLSKATPRNAVAARGRWKGKRPPKAAAPPRRPYLPPWSCRGSSSPCTSRWTRTAAEQPPSRTGPLPALWPPSSRLLRSLRLSSGEATSPGCSEGGIYRALQRQGRKESMWGRCRGQVWMAVGGCDCGRPLPDEGRRRLHRRIRLFALNARGWRYASQSAVRGVDTCSSATRSTCVRGFLCCLLSLSRAWWCRRGNKVFDEMLSPSWCKMYIF